MVGSIFFGCVVGNLGVNVGEVESVFGAADDWTVLVSVVAGKDRKVAFLWVAILIVNFGMDG